MTSTPSHTRRRARVGTIVWGALLVAVAVVAIAVLTSGPLSPAAGLWVIVGFGVLLIVSALIAAIVRAARPRDTALPDSEDQPTG
jgi:hypothetical protein